MCERESEREREEGDGDGDRERGRERGKECVSVCEREYTDLMSVVGDLARSSPHCWSCSKEQLQRDSGPPDHEQGQPQQLK